MDDRKSVTCFLVAKPGSTAKRLVVDYGELNKKTLNHSGSIPNMKSTLEKIAFCRYKTKMDKRSGFWQVDVTPNAQELLAFITPQGRVFKWKVMPFGVANAPALFQELMNKILSILRGRAKVQELISCGAQMEAHIDDVCLGTNTQEDHLIQLGDFFAVCQENHTRLKPEKCEFMQETMQYLGFDVGYGWWTPAASKAKPLMDAKVRHGDPKKGLHDVRSFIGACNFYRRHIKNFTYTSAILTDLIKKSTTWRWGPQEQQAFLSQNKTFIKIPPLEPHIPQLPEHNIFSLNFISTFQSHQFRPPPPKISLLCSKKTPTEPPLPTERCMKAPPPPRNHRSHLPPIFP